MFNERGVIFRKWLARAYVPTGIEKKSSMPDLKLAEEFSQLYREMDHAMKRCGLLKGKARRAEADWAALAELLGKSFFEEVLKSGQANTLLNEPPRKLMASLNWEPEHPVPLRTVRELFERGVCQVRHNYSHGEKYIGAAIDVARDDELVAQAKWTLELAKERFPAVTGRKWPFEAKAK